MSGQYYLNGSKNAEPTASAYRTCITSWIFHITGNKNHCDHIIRGPCHCSLQISRSPRHCWHVHLLSNTTYGHMELQASNARARVRTRSHLYPSRARSANLESLPPAKRMQRRSRVLTTDPTPQATLSPRKVDALIAQPHAA